MILVGDSCVQTVDKTKRRKGERKGRKASYRLWCFSELLRYALGNKRKEEESKSTVRTNQDAKLQCGMLTHFSTLYRLIGKVTVKEQAEIQK